VFGVDTEGHPRMGSLALDGSVRAGDKVRALGGLNQYALPENSVGAFTSGWGSASRVRATCGSDTRRADPCATETYEVTVRAGRVVSSADKPGDGAVPSGTTVLVGREAGARWLRELSTGDPVSVRHRLVDAASRTPYRFAIGGYPVLDDGTPRPGLNDTTAAVRTAVGVSGDGRTMLLLATDGGPEYRSGLTIAEVADTMRKLGSSDAFSLDGGGSTTLVARKPDAATVSVRNHPSGGTERPVPNGIGVLTRP
jgi:Phosphodiester glycosidase